MEQDLASEPSIAKPKPSMNAWKILTVIFALLFIAALFTRGFTLLNITGKAVLSEDEAKTKADDFIQKYLALPGVSIELKELSEVSGLYKLDITASGDGQSQDASAYISKDGKLFFLQAIPLDEIENLLNQQQASGDIQEIGTPTEIILSEDDDPSIGNKDAPVTILEFSDFECPFCARFVDDTFPEIKREYIDTGKVLFVFKDFPLINIHKDAFNAALAADCANEQGKFWEMHDLLFDNQRNLEKKDLKSYASKLKLDIAKFNSCLDSESYKDEISQDSAEATGLGITGTPTFIINGRQLKGAATFESFKEIIDEELAKG